MPNEPAPSKREAARRAAQVRHEARAALRHWSFDALAQGWSVEQIAEMRKVRPRSIRREIAAVTAEKRLDAPARFVHVQVARLNKALRVADGALDRGNLRAVGPMVRVVAALDRYHGLGSAEARRAVAVEALPAHTAPLALSHAAPPFAAPRRRAYAESEKGTDFGA
jgi:AraC-like DNA-binding protein